jgi:signal transduction histidine kinase
MMDGKLLTALENERRHVARELHDGVAQTTLQLGLQVGICNKLLERGNMEMLADELAELERRIQLVSSQVREIIADMRQPRVEPDADLNDFIEFAIDAHLERKGPPVDRSLSLDQPPGLSPEQALGIFRILQEALLNVRKHAEAQNVRVALTEDENNAYLKIADDGKGFDAAEVVALPIDKGGAGLANLQARAQAIGGSLTVGTDETGNWTEVTFTLPK